MLLTLGACESKPVLMYGNSQNTNSGDVIQTLNFFRRLGQRFRKTGKVLPTALQKSELPTGKMNEDTIIATVARELWIRLRCISRDLELSQIKALEVLLDNQLNLYHYSQKTSVSGLSPCTAAVRINRGRSRFDSFIPWTT